MLRARRQGFLGMTLLLCWTLWPGSIAIASDLGSQSISASAPGFTGPSTLVIPSGGFSLKWTHPNSDVSSHFELQQGLTRNFSSAQTVYSGRDQGTYISGLPNGDFFYRVRAVGPRDMPTGPWSSPIRRTVDHPSLAFALSLMGVGAGVFLATIVMIARGMCQEPRESMGLADEGQYGEVKETGGKHA